MNAYVIREIESTMGEIHTTAALKVDRIARALIGLEHAWNAKSPCCKQRPQRKYYTLIV